MELSLCDITKEVSFELVRRSSIKPGEDLRWVFRPIYLELTSAIKKQKHMQKYRIDNLYNKAIKDFCVDYFKKFDVAKFLVVRYYCSSGKSGFEIHRFGTKRSAKKYINSLQNKGTLIIFYDGIQVDMNFFHVNYKYEPLLEKLFEEQIIFSENDWRQIAAT